MARSKATTPNTGKNSSRRTTSRSRSRRAKAVTDTPVRGGSDTSDTRVYSVVYIHGVGAQEGAAATKRNWDTALFGQDMGNTTDIAYWADIRHPGAGHGPQARTRSRRTPSSAAAQRYKEEMRAAFEGRRRPVEPAGSYEGAVFGRFLPGVGDAMFKWLTERFIDDTNAYFHDAAQREAMQRRLVDALERNAPRPIILVAHSQGSIIAYDVLTRLGGHTPSGHTLDVAAFVTVGSQLGVDQVQRKLLRARPSPPRGNVPAAVRAWTNLADAFDPIALDKTLTGEFKSGEDPPVNIHDVSLRNKVFWNPHSAVGYLSTPQVQSVVYSVLGWNRLSYGRRLRRDVLADIVQMMARREVGDTLVPEERHHVLIELRDEAGFGAAARLGVEKQEVPSLDDNRGLVVAYLEKELDEPDDAWIDPLKRFVAARLTASEIQVLETDCNTSVYCVWKSTRKRALIDRSAAVVQAPAAHIGYKAEGKGIAWAVLDTGVQSDHPHFDSYSNVVRVWDCTQRGDPKPLYQKGRRVSRDRDGHGTHVCGIIAGQQPANPAGATVSRRGMAPQAQLHVYKVLDDGGFGEDAWIIKAIDHIADTNNRAAGVSIHGVNLSLGGSFDPEVYGCGHSPICQELRRLWRQGLVVCVACGNEGAVELSTPNGPQTLNTFLSIGDPANLDECIAVGSVHTDNPHSYGISHFSSRGPTADGRAKPDLVAPGERISSCNSQFSPNTPASHYISLDGTSMATPHVSGLLAAFLSVRREFIGRPDDVKRILLDNCTDLARDRYLQGAGMPNLIKMLTNT
jgi:subtilisin family serine protease